MSTSICLAQSTFLKGSLVINETITHIKFHVRLTGCWLVKSTLHGQDKGLVFDLRQEATRQSGAMQMTVPFGMLLASTSNKPFLDQ